MLTVWLLASSLLFDKAAVAGQEQCYDTAYTQPTFNANNKPSKCLSLGAIKTTFSLIGIPSWFDILTEKMHIHLDDALEASDDSDICHM